MYHSGGTSITTRPFSSTDADFDFLYYIDLTPNPLILHLLARSKAKCRVGKNFDEGQSYLELAIDAVGNNQSLTDEMYKYTTQLK